MSLKYHKLSSEGLLALLTALVFLVPGGKAVSQSATRSFQMSVFEGPGPVPTLADFDIRSRSTTTGHFILTGLSSNTQLSTLNVDWSRVVAAEVDEPYGPQADPKIDSVIKYPSGGPACEGDPSVYIAPIDAALDNMAKDLKARAPKARFWVTLTQAEANWIGTCHTPQVFDRPYIDVISADWYDAYFSTIQPFYTAVVAANPDQQLALIPGVFSAPHNQLPYLQGYFDYANHMNQTCDLPLGTRGFTGIYDGCRVWIVEGWLSGEELEGGTYVGLLEPGSQAITAAWEAEVALPPGPALQRAKAKIIQPIQQMLLLQ